MKKNCDCIDKAQMMLMRRVHANVSIDTYTCEDDVERISIFGTYRPHLNDGTFGKEKRVYLHVKYCPFCGKPYGDK